MNFMSFLVLVPMALVLMRQKSVSKNTDSMKFRKYIKLLYSSDL